MIVVVQKEGRSWSWYSHVVLPAPLRPYIWRLLFRKTNILDDLNHKYRGLSRLLTATITEVTFNGLIQTQHT
jgi:hypothetical protein